MGSDPERAKVALGFMESLFRIERAVADAPRRKKEKMREKRSRHIVDAFFSWCDRRSAVGSRRHADRGWHSLRAQSARWPCEVHRGWPPSYSQQHERACASSRSRRTEELALRRQRRWRSHRRDLHLAPRERRALQDRTVGVPAPSLLPTLELAGAPDARSRSAELGADERS